MANEFTQLGSIEEKFNSLIIARPSLLDDDNDFTTIDDVSTATTSDFGKDKLVMGQFRKQNVELLDADDDRYLGKKSSRFELRRRLYSDSSDLDRSTDKNIDNATFKNNVVQTNRQLESYDVSLLDTKKCTAGSEILDVKLIEKCSEDILKGKGVQNQLGIWDSLLECRVKFQQCLVCSNQLPTFQNMDKFISHGGQEFAVLLSASQNALEQLLNSFLDLQDILLKMNKDYQKCSYNHGMLYNSELNQIISISNKNSLQQGKLFDFSVRIENSHQKMVPYRNQTIQKWNDKTRIDNFSNKNFNAFEQSTLKQIEQVLLDKQKLIKRTQIKRTNYHILGQVHDEIFSKKKKLDEETHTNVNIQNHNLKKEKYIINNEIFDDNDFYHLLINEYIKKTSFFASDSLGIGNRRYQLEKIRSKMKKKIDVRATKGRKIRYIIHQKLINFMMPVENTYSEGSRFELFHSLFGKSQRDYN